MADEEEDTTPYVWKGRGPTMGTLGRLLMESYSDALKKQMEFQNEPVFLRHLSQLPPVYGPPAPPWWELELDQYLTEGLTEDGLRLELLRLIDRVIDAHSEW